MTRFARWGSMLMAAAVLVTACTKDNVSTAAPSQAKQQVDTLRALPFGEAALRVVTDVLAGAGVGLHDDNAEVTTGQPVRVTRWQARNLAAEAANGGGITGEALSALAPVQQGAAPVHYLLAAWVKSYDSPSAVFARELMGEQNWRNAGQILFPSLVLTLFLADATAGVKVPTGQKAQSMALAAMAAEGVCTFAATFIQHAIADVAAALKVDASGGGFFGFLGKIWNVAVDLAAGAVQALITTFTKPIVSLVVDAFGVLAMITQLSSFLVKWRADLRAEPSHTWFGVDSEVITGQFKLTVAQNQLPIPDFIVQCAGAFGLDLRNAGSAAGSKVTWSQTNFGRTDLYTRLGADDTLAQDKSARYRYQTGQESSELAKSPDTESRALAVSASVHRNDIQKTRELFEHLLLNQIDERIRPAVEFIVQPLRAAADSKLRAITDVNASARTYISYHVPDKKTPTPPPPGTGPGSKKATIPHTGFCGGTAVTAFGYREPEMQLTGDGWVCFFLRNPGEYQLVVRILNYPLTAPVVPDAEPVAIPGATVAWIDDNCTSQTGPCYSIDAVVGNQTLQISGADSQDNAIAIVKAILGVA